MVQGFGKKRIAEAATRDLRAAAHRGNPALSERDVCGWPSPLAVHACCANDANATANDDAGRGCASMKVEPAKPKVTCWLGAA
jgi:hypothetical protein